MSATAVLGASLLLFVSVTGAQNAAPAAKRSRQTNPRSLDGHPDLTGFWAQAVAGIPGYGQEPLGEAGNLTKLPDGSFLFLYGGAEAQNPGSGSA